MQPVGNPPARHPLDGDGEAVGHRGRAGDGVGAHHRLAVDLQLQGDELARLEEEQDRLVGHEAEGAYVPGFLDDLDAAHEVPAVGPGLGGDRIEEVARHDDLSVRTGPNDGLMGRIVRIAVAAHLPASDIYMLIATCLLGRGPERRKRMRSCRPWIRSAAGAGPHSRPAETRVCMNPGRVEPGRVERLTFIPATAGPVHRQGGIPDAAPG